jgi:hypothetical protein
MKIHLAALSSLAVAAAQLLLLVPIAPIGRGETADSPNPSADQAAAANPTAAGDLNPGAEASGSGQLQPVVVTGFRHVTSRDVGLAESGS